jgi:methylglyoxal synthase
MSESRKLPFRKRIALVAHDNKKRDIIEWALFNKYSWPNMNYWQLAQQEDYLKNN